MDLDDPRLRSLVVAGVRPDHLLRQAEAWGLDPGQLIPLARQVLEPRMDEDPACAALCLALGSAQHWQVLLPLARSAFRHVIPALRGGWGLEELESRFDAETWAALRRRMRQRFGYPGSLQGQSRQTVATSPDVPEWLDEGMFVLEPSLELKGFASAAPTWEVQTTDLRLSEGQGPEWLFINPMYGGAGYDAPDSLRMRGVAGTRGIRGLSERSQVVLSDCPDVAEIQGSPFALVARSCPRLELVCLPTRCGLVHLQDCAQLKDLEIASDLDLGFQALSVRELIVEACPRLSLPDVLRVERTMRVRRQDGRFRWPRDLWIGGDLILQACPGLETLPPLEVGGSLRVTGASGLRTLEPGLDIGGDLDLRACSLLEGLPSGVRVRGRVLLPPHLGGSGGKAAWRQVPMFQVDEEVQPESFERDLRTLLKALAFADQATPGERPGLRSEAGRILPSLRVRAGASPAAESAMLYAASEIWDDLARAQWEADKPYEWWNEEIQDLPVAWFRALLFGRPCAWHDPSDRRGGSPLTHAPAGEG